MYGKRTGRIITIIIIIIVIFFLTRSNAREQPSRVFRQLSFHHFRNPPLYFQFCIYNIRVYIFTRACLP